jgi:hypothetical protein
MPCLIAAAFRQVEWRKPGCFAQEEEKGGDWNMRDIRYTLLRQKIVADQSYRAGARCFLRLIEDGKRQCGPRERVDSP